MYLYVDGICERADDVCFVFSFSLILRCAFPKPRWLDTHHRRAVSGYLKPQFESTVIMKVSWINHLKASWLIYTVPGTQMTIFFLLEKGLVLKGWGPNKGQRVPGKELRCFILEPKISWVFYSEKQNTKNNSKQLGWPPGFTVRFNGLTNPWAAQTMASGKKRRNPVSMCLKIWEIPPKNWHKTTQLFWWIWPTRPAKHFTRWWSKPAFKHKQYKSTLWIQVAARNALRVQFGGYSTFLGGTWIHNAILDASTLPICGGWMNIKVLETSTTRQFTQISSHDTFQLQRKPPHLPPKTDLNLPS